MTDLKLLLLHSSTWNHSTTLKRAQARVKMLPTIVFTNRIFNIWIKRICHYITYNDWYAIKPNSTKLNQLYFQRSVILLFNRTICLYNMDRQQKRLWYCPTNTVYRISDTYKIPNNLWKFELALTQDSHWLKTHTDSKWLKPSHVHLNIPFCNSHTFPMNHVTASAYWCVLFRESLIDSSCKEQYEIIGMKFGMEKGALLIMKKKKR